ncbi:unnamed protein product [Eruca vesicaria subsp. sativa]|uniref:Uncharacterized protein n=1 Tax=Eruca vesicaria subsp. sativa TaxID=29727 RepID=A0ABC8JC46_ERUVS|nr:unnamed protein product [Eruca vesicaria subsp. sativa]
MSMVVIVVEWLRRRKVGRCRVMRILRIGHGHSKFELEIAVRFHNNAAKLLNGKISNQSNTLLEV